MITPLTLASLACLMANGQPTNENLTTQLTNQQLAQMENFVASGGCLPENLEKLIQVSKNTGEAQAIASLPTRECLGE